MILKPIDATLVNDLGTIKKRSFVYGLIKNTPTKIFCNKFVHDIIMTNMLMYNEIYKIEIYKNVKIWDIVT
jgi:hypothetical protein